MTALRTDGVGQLVTFLPPVASRWLGVQLDGRNTRDGSLAAIHRFDFLNRANADYIDRLYQQYLQDPLSLDDTWQAYFAGFEDGGTRDPAPHRTSSGEPITLGVHNLVHSYRELGHFEARLDPLGHQRPPHPLLDLSRFGITEADLSLTTGKADFHGQTDGTLRDLLTKLRATYCGNLGVEYMSISDKTQRDWLSQQMESILNKPAC